MSELISSDEYASTLVLVLVPRDYLLFPCHYTQNVWYIYIYELYIVPATCENEKEIVRKYLAV